MSIADHHEYCTGGFSPDDIVISGMTGRFPQCDSVGELHEALLTQRNLLEQNNDRYEKGAFNLPFSSSGTIKNLDKFDANFFRIPSSTAHLMDPLLRGIMEASYEAMVDSGYEPLSEFAGANIGVYSAITNQDSKDVVIARKDQKITLNAYARTMFANQCSYTLDLKGPSFTVDGACSSSFIALCCAFNDIKDGRVDAAIVNGGQICLNPHNTYLYQEIGIISPTCTADPFEARGNGMVRTEGITALFLQKASVARRAYATVLAIKHSDAGYVPEGIFVPSVKAETQLFLDVLQQSGLSTNDIQYIEAHGTGTVVGDPLEVQAIEAAYCKGRKDPLYIGTTKSNVGHTESAAGACGAIKVILAFETGIIAPNRGFEKPKPELESVMKGDIRVVAEPLPLTSPYVPINCFGFGGSLVHAILKRNPIEYSDVPERRDHRLPRLVLFSATTEGAVLSVFDYVEEHPELRDEFFALLNKLSFAPIARKPFRGYALFQEENPAVVVQKTKCNREVWFVMTGMGCQWPGMGLEMMQLDVFAESMKKSASVLKPLGIDLFELLRKDEKHLLTHRRITPAFVAIAAIQIALIDALRTLQIHPNGIIGHSTGELLCAYADGCCNAEQTILSAYWRGKAIESANLVNGAMAAVGLTWEEAVQRCPKDVYPACHNADDSVTISGMKEPVEKFVAELQKENIFARVVNAYGYAFHSELIWPASKALRSALQKVILNPQPRTDRWISTSYPEEEWAKEDCRMAGPEYFVHNLMSVVRFNEALKKIPSDAITIEIGPHFLLQSILKRSVGSDASHIGLMKRNDDSNIKFFFESLGKLYVEGIDPKIELLYPPVKFPVPRNTPVISDLIKWDHSESWYVPKWMPQSGSYFHKFKLDTEDSYLLDHFIDGRPLFPATGYVFVAWQALAQKLEKPFDEINVVLEDFKIHRATILNPGSILAFNVVILDTSGTFEIMTGNSLVASGKIYEEPNMKFAQPSPTVSKGSSTFVSGEEIYSELRIHGYEYGPAFRKLMEANLNGSEGFVTWKDWITFMDALLLFYMFTRSKTDFVLPTGVLSFKINPTLLKKSAEDCKNKRLPGIPVNYHADSKTCRAAGVEIAKLEVDEAPQHIKSDDCILEEYKFIPYAHKYSPTNIELEKYVVACNIAIEEMEESFKVNLSHGKFRVKQDMDFDIDTYIMDLKPEHKILSTLKKISTACKLTDLQQRDDIYCNIFQDIGEDILNNLLVNDYCLRYMFDIITENSFRKPSVIEINNNFTVILPAIVEMVENSAMIKFKTKSLIYKNEEKIDKDLINDCNIEVFSTLAAVKNKKYSVVISSVCTDTNEKAQKHIHLLSSTVEQRGFILLFHKNFISPPELLAFSLANKSIPIVPDTVLHRLFQSENLVIVSQITDSLGGNLYLLRHAAPVEPQKLIMMTDDAKWLDELKSSVTNSIDTTWLLSEVYTSGLIGMVNCLRHEPGGEKVRCVFIPERSKVKHMPPFSLTDTFYKGILNKDLVMNVFKDGAWGSFRHVRLPKESETTEADYSFLSIKKYGDLSSLFWMESAVKYIQVPDENFVYIYYSALNFRDIMLATGKISKQTARIKGIGTEYDDCLFGLEFSGRNKKGQRVAGIVMSRGIATASSLNPATCFIIPDHWSLEDAATVPVVYTTCYYALIIRGRLKPGYSILIHSGAGGIGLAAINIALSMNCQVFTTVGTEEKRLYLLKTFPQLRNENIGCSRDTTFEQMIMTRTKGNGVDVVLNSLADEKFYASIRCVANHGRFVEIGKYDLSLDHTIGLKFFLRNISFEGVFVDHILDGSVIGTQDVKETFSLLRDGIRKGVVKPLKRTVFPREEVEKGFRYMAGGTHIGKVLIKIRDEEEQKIVIPKDLKLHVVPATYFYYQKVYIVIGGLGGFGIEVCNWLLSKGARNLVLTSRYGARTPYHHLCLKRWKDEKYNVIISTRNVTLLEEAEKLLKEVQDIGPIGGIFNSAVVLKDAFLENVDYKSFKEVCAPKAYATLNLDALSRRMCPELDHFVCFSSISCGRGNAGQMNYGYANSVMERVCEQRRDAGLPGLAIQWGIIGEVGVVHRHMGDDAMIAGVIAQRVKSCLNMLELSCQLKRPVVSSYVIKDSSQKVGDQADVLQRLAKIFGLKDASEFNTTSSFGEMGVDSIVGVEIKQLLETTCDTTFTAREIQGLNVEAVKALLEQFETQKKDTPQSRLVTTASASLPKPTSHSKVIEKLNAVKDGSPVFILDLDCNDVSQLQLLGEAISQPAFALLWTKDTPTSNVESLASWYLKKMKEVNWKEAHLIALSTSSCVAFEMALQDLKSGGSIKTLTVLNGSLFLMKAVNINDAERQTDTGVLINFVEDYIPSARNKLEQLLKAPDFDQQLQTVVDLFATSSAEAVDKTELSGIISSHVKKILLLGIYAPKTKLMKDLQIIEDSTKLLANDIAEVKGVLSEICGGKINIQRIPGLECFTEDSVEKFGLHWKNN